MGKGDKVSIELVGGPPWGFRLGGGADFGCPLEIAKLRKKSKAFEAGLAEGDVVTSIDHQDVSKKSHGDAMKIIEVAGSTLKLEIIKGVGPSAGLMSSSLMGDSMIINQTDGLEMNNNNNSTNKPLEATVVRSREPSVARSYAEPQREKSVSRTITIVQSSAQKVDNQPKQPAKQTEPWTVDVTSYQFADSFPASASAPAPTQSHTTFAQANITQPKPAQTLSAPTQSKQPPPTSPKPRFKAPQFPKPAEDKKPSTVCPVLQPWGAPPSDPSLKHIWSPEPSQPSQTPAVTKPAPMFKVAKFDAKKEKWQPTTVKNVDYNDSRHKFNADGVIYSPQASVTSVSSHKSEPPQQQQTPPAFSPASPASSSGPKHYHVPNPPPIKLMSPPKPENHVPGMVNPLICDDSQGDFGANPIVRPNPARDVHKQRKMYSDSAFYDAPGMEYPTIQEQVALCKEIANFLESNQNKRSKGGRMFMKRKQKSDQWSLDSQGQRRDLQQSMAMDMYTQEPKNHYHPLERREFGYNSVRHHPDPIKAKLTAAELEEIQHAQGSLCKHDSLPPYLAFDINQALSQSHGKAGQIFEKRRQRAEKYVVDENNRRQDVQIPIQFEEPDYGYTKPYVSPWQAAMEGRLDTAFADMNTKPSYSSYSSQTSMSRSVPIQPVPTQQYQPLNVITNQNQQQQQQPVQLNVKYKTFKPVNPPVQSSSMGYSQSSNTLPKPKTRLEMMLSGGADTNPSPYGPMSQSYTESTSYNSYPGVMQQSSVDSRYTYNQPSTNSPAQYSSMNVQQNQGQPTSSFTMNLRRPKDYMGQGGNPARANMMSAF